MQTLLAGLSYFALAFGAGFALGIIRTLWAVPLFGTRMAELLEMPIMLLVIIFAARWIVRRFSVPFAVSSRLGMGSIALGLLLVAELTLVLWLQGQTISENLATRDPVSGAAYGLMLLVFAAMPLLVARK